MNNKTEEFDFKELLKLGAILAGGAVRDMKTNMATKDYDLYFIEPESLYKTVKMLGNPIASTSNTQTFTYKGKVVQVISKDFFGSPMSVINQFDFNICRGFITSEQEYFSPQRRLLLTSTMATN